MEELITKMGDTLISLKENLDKYSTGNKAAGCRARKDTLTMEKLGKEFRKLSVKESAK